MFEYISKEDIRSPHELDEISTNPWFTYSWTADCFIHGLFFLLWVAFEWLGMGGSSYDYQEKIFLSFIDSKLTSYFWYAKEWFQILLNNARDELHVLFYIIEHALLSFFCNNQLPSITMHMEGNICWSF